jgi:hypothetical protein
MNQYDNPLIEAKRELYSILLRKEYLTDAEINIAYELSKDDEIQSLLQDTQKSLGEKFLMDVKEKASQKQSLWTC